MLLPVLLNYDRGCIKRVTTCLCGVQGVRGIRKIEQRLNIQKISTWNVVIVGFSFGRNKHRHTKVDCLNLIEMLHGGVIGALIIQLLDCRVYTGCPTS